MIVLPVVGGCFLVGGVVFADEAKKPVVVDPSVKMWETQVKGLMEKHCTKCHGARKQRNQLDVSTLRGVISGGKSGAAVVAGKPEKSLLYQMTAGDHEDRMPPEDKGRALNEKERAMIWQWILHLPQPKIEHAAKWDKSGETKLWWNEKMALPKGDADGTAVVDGLIEKGYERYGAAASGVIDDSGFVRRVYLDLLGRIPTVSEREVFIKDGRADKREKLVDMLLESGEYARRMAEVFDVLLMGRPEKSREYRARTDRGWFHFLEHGFKVNKPWDVMMREMLVARNEKKETRGANYFIASERNDGKAIAEKISIAAFGIDVQCAQCHDHKIALEVKQADYWGLIAIYRLSTKVGTSHGEDLGELAYAKPLQFADLKGKTYRPALGFLDGRVIGEQVSEEPKEHKAEDYVVAPKFEGKEKRLKNFAIPKVSRREQFVDKIVKGNPRLSLAMVNRVWAVVMGRGIVHPVNKIDSVHLPSHPELLKWLADDFEKHGYDVKRLVKQLVMSRTYQLDSRPLGTPSEEASFAYGLSKPLTGEAYHNAIMVALFGKVGQKDSALFEEVRELFPDVLPEEVNSSPAQALYLTNNKTMQRLVAVQPGSLAEELMKIDDTKALVKRAFVQVLGREAEGDEEAAIVKYFEARKDRKADAVSQLLWALISGAEFRFNH